MPTTRWRSMKQNLKMPTSLFETSTIPVEVFVSMFGETKTEGTGLDDSKADRADLKSERRAGIRRLRLCFRRGRGRRRKYLTYVVHKVKFSLPE